MSRISVHSNMHEEFFLLPFILIEFIFRETFLDRSQLPSIPIVLVVDHVADHA